MYRSRGVVALTLVLSLLSGTYGIADAATLEVSGSSSVKVGSRIQINSSESGVSYSVSDKKIASISKSGFLTGKKAGKVTVKIKSSSGDVASKKVTVKSVSKKPNLPVTVDEISVVDEKISEDASSPSGYTYSFSVKNYSPSKAKKVIYTYEVTYSNAAVPTAEPSVAPTSSPEVTSTPKAEVTPEVTVTPDPSASSEVTATPDASVAPTSDVSDPAISTRTDEGSTTKKVSFTFKSVGAGKTSSAVSGIGSGDGKIESMKLVSIKVYSGKALHTYTASTNKYSYGWGVPDTKAPKFSGYIKSKSKYDGIPVLSVYSDKKSAINYKRFVKATDDRDSKVTIKVDKSKINWNKTGIYKVYFTANDKAGNKAKTWSYVEVTVKGDAETLADNVLGSITKSSWSDTKKARAIYRYVRGHCSYVDNGTHSNYRGAAARGFIYHSGDCFTYYSMSRVLLSRAGIPNLMVKRYPFHEGHRHWWNLVYVQGGWYHFDTTPRAAGGVFCLRTDAQLRAYSSGNTFAFKSSLLPKRATKAIS